jgi:hypothetical protein
MSFFYLQYRLLIIVETNILRLSGQSLFAMYISLGMHALSLVLLFLLSS